MTVGPYGGAFGGTVFDPSQAPQTPAGTPLVIPQVRTFDADTTSRMASLAPAGGPGNGRLVRRVTITGPAGSSASLFIGDPTNDHNRADGSAAGDFDVAEYDPELYVPVGMALSIVWDTPGRAFMRVEWTDLP